jgi:hypothetical protein
MKSTPSSRRQLVLATAAALALTAEGCRRPEVRPPAPDTASPATPVDPGITSAQRLVEAMRDRYDGKWYNTLTLVQTSTFYNQADGTVRLTQIWPESAMIPGRLRIDIGNPAVGNAVIYANDTIYQFQQRRLISRQAGNNPLQVLGFDVYHLPVSRTLEILSSIGYDLSTMYRTNHEGRDYYVVGARQGDLRRKQFWIDADRLLVGRVLEPWLPTDTVNVREFRFQGYRELGGGWVPEAVDYLRNGTRYLSGKYGDVHTDVAVDPALFDPRQFTTAKHWYKAPATGTRP